MSDDATCLKIIDTKDVVYDWKNGLAKILFFSHLEG